MKRTVLSIAFFAGLFLMVSCSDKDGIDIGVNDPQHIEFVQTVIDADLVEAFGVEHIHFGHTPPNLEGISFYVQGMDYISCKRYIFNATDPSADPILSHADPPTYDASRNYHHFYNYIENISSHKLKTLDAYNDTYIRTNDTVYVIGIADSLWFTAYYEEVLQEEGSGYPTNGILISGTLVYDTLGNFLGVNDYRIGKKIIRYQEHPTTPSYAQGTIEIKVHEGMAPNLIWDTIR